VDVDWCRDNVPRYIRSARLVARHNNVGAAALEAIAAEIDRVPAIWPARRASWERLHTFELDVEVTKASYVAHLVVGVEFDTTAFDAWVESPAELARAETAAAAERSLELVTRQRFDAFIDALLAKRWIELEPGQRAALVKRLARVDAADEIAFSRQVIHILTTSQAVQELYATDEEIFGEVRALLRGG
jgi:hypothetical protein